MSIERAREVLKAKARDGKLIRLDPIERAKRNPKSRRLAVNAKCFDCQGRDADPCVAWRIGNCEIPACALWPVRPHQHLFGKPTPPGLLASTQLEESGASETIANLGQARLEKPTGDSPVQKRKWAS